jgi:hypothetical protein
VTHREFEHAELQVRRAEAGRSSVEFPRSETFELGLHDEDLSIMVAFSPPRSR